VLVALDSAGNAEALRDIGHKIGLHVAAGSPLWVSREDIPPEVVAAKRAALTDQAHKTGKPKEIVEKMVAGRMRKFYEEVVLTLQPFVLNPDQRVEHALKEAEKAAGAPIAIEAFIRFRTGEGMDTKAECRTRRFPCLPSQAFSKRTLSATSVLAMDSLAVRSMSGFTRNRTTDGTSRLRLIDSHSAMTPPATSS